LRGGKEAKAFALGESRSSQGKKDGGRRSLTTTIKTGKKIFGRGAMGVGKGLSKRSERGFILRCEGFLRFLKKNWKKSQKEKDCPYQGGGKKRIVGKKRFWGNRR